MGQMVTMGISDPLIRLGNAMEMSTVTNWCEANKRPGDTEQDLAWFHINTY